MVIIMLAKCKLLRSRNKFLVLDAFYIAAFSLNIAFVMEVWINYASINYV